MARRCQMLPVSGFSDCSWAECDVVRRRPKATRNSLERANLLLGGSPWVVRKLEWNPLQPRTPPPKSMKFYVPMFNDKPPCMPLRFGIVERRCNHIARGGRGSFFFHIFFMITFFFFFHFFLFLRLCFPVSFGPAGLCNC